MIFTKIWLVLIAIISTFTWGIAGVVSKSSQRQLHQSQIQTLDQIQQNAELMLRLQARQWIDAAAAMANDRSLIKIIEQTSEGTYDNKMSYLSRDRLLSLMSGLTSDKRPELIIILDKNGKQISRIGIGENSFVPGKTGLIGYPLVQTALRGYLADDTWNIDNKLFLMAAAPIASKAKGRYVGAVLLGIEFNDKSVSRFRKYLNGNDIAFFLRGRMVGSTNQKFKALTKLPLQLEKERKTILENGRSKAIVIGEEDSAHKIIMGILPGEASVHDAFFAVVTPTTPSLGLFSMIGRISTQDLSWSEFPWLLYAGLLIVFSIAGLGIFIWEIDLPLRNLLQHLLKAGKGERQRINESQFRGNILSIVKAIHHSITESEKRSSSLHNKEQGTKSNKRPTSEIKLTQSFSEMPPLATTNLKSIDNINVNTISGPLNAIDLPIAARAGTREIQSSNTTQSHSSSAFSDNNTGNFPAASASMFSSKGLPHSFNDSSTELPQIAPMPLPTGGASIMNHSVSLNLPPTSSSPPTSLNTHQLPDLESNHVRNPSVTTSLPPLSEEGQGSDSFGSLAPTPVVENPIPTTPLTHMTLGQAPAVQPSLAIQDPSSEGTVFAITEETDLEQYFMQIYNSFIAIKRQCGETIDNLSYQRFSGKLKQNRQSLIERYNCKSVKFQVYIKDGKAALKATPIKD